MGDQKLLKRFRQFCEDYRAEYAFEGTVEGFDTIDIVDPERLTRGFYVSREKVRSLVGLDSRRKPPVEIGDAVIVVGRDVRYEENRVVPAVILIPKGRHSLFSRGFQTRLSLITILWSLPFMAGVILVLLSPWIVPQMMEYAWLIIPLLLMFSFSPCVDSYLTDQSRRPRVYHCDEETWCLLIGEISTKFGITLTT